MQTVKFQADCVSKQNFPITECELFYISMIGDKNYSARHLKTASGYSKIAK
jgi:hypothetical protein